MMERGADEEEVIETLKTGREISAKRGRGARSKIFMYNKEWLGNWYPEKKVEVIYVEEKDELVVITVKVYFGSWEEPG